MSRDKPLIGVLKNKLKPSYKLKKTADLNVDLIVFSHKTTDWDKEMVKGLLLVNGKFEERVLSFPDAVFMRKYTTTNKLANKIEEVIGEGKVFNVVTRFDKWKIHSILKNSSSANRHLLGTHKYNKDKPKKIIDILNKYKKIIIKPRKGALGKNIYALAKDSNNMFYLYHHLNSPELSTESEKILLDKLDTITAGKQEYIIQEFIDFDRIDNQLYDIRIYVQKNGSGLWEVTGGYGRLSGPNFYKSNFASKLIKLEELLEEINRLTQEKLYYIKNVSLQVAKELEKGYGHLGDICVDFGLGIDGHIWVIEVNSKAGKNVITRLGDKTFTRKVYLRPIEYARYLALKETFYESSI